MNKLLIVISAIFLSWTANAANKLNTSSPKPVKITASLMDATKPKLIVETHFPYSGILIPLGPMGTESMRLALDALKQNQSLAINRYEIVLEFKDDMCDHGVGVSLMTEFLEHEKIANASQHVMPIVAGPICAHAAYVGPMMKYYNVAAITWGSPVLAIFTNRRAFSAIFSIEPSFEILHEAIPAFLESNGWKKVFLFSESFSFWDEFELILQRHLANRSIALRGVVKLLTVTGILPSSEHFESAVAELASHDPRIVILDTGFASMIACWLHRYKLYGPNYVYLVVNFGMFLPNNQFRDYGCTDNMLYEVLQSFFVFNFAFPINSYGDAAELTGLRASEFDQAMKARIERPELDSSWFYFRAAGYDQAMATFLTLNAAEEELQRNSDSLLNWSMASTNFKRNGSYIHNMLLKHASQLSFDGFCTNRQGKLNSRTGVTGFYQFQSLNAVDDYTERFKIVAVASYDTKSKVFSRLGPYLWRTPTGQVPYDSLRILDVEQELLHGHNGIARWVLVASSSFLVISSLVFFIVDKNRINRLLLSGNLLILIFVIVFLTGSSHASCTAAMMLCVCGFSLTYFAIFAKMELAYWLMTKYYSAQFRTSSAISFSTLPAGNSQKHPRRNYIDMDADSRQHDIATGSISTLTVLQLVLTALWLGFNPIKSFKIQRSLEYSQHDWSVAYRGLAWSCKLPINSDLSLGLLATIFIIFVLTFLRSVQLAFTLRKFSFKAIDDFATIRIVSYSLAIVVIAGAVAVWTFFNDPVDPAITVVAVAVIAQIVVLTAQLIVFIPKLCKGHQ